MVSREWINFEPSGLVNSPGTRQRLTIALRTETVLSQWAHYRYCCVGSAGAAPQCKPYGTLFVGRRFLCGAPVDAALEIFGLAAA
jgi:hypothetical protein